MHEVEGEMETDDKEPEVEFAEFFVVETATHFGEPIIEGAKDSEEDGANDDVMKVSNDKIGIGELPIEGSSTQHNASESSNEELEKEGNAEEHGGFENELAAPHGAEPIEDFDSGGNSNDHGGKDKETCCRRRSCQR